MWKKDKYFLKYCTCKDELQEKVMHEEFRKLRNNITYLIRKSTNEHFRMYFEKIETTHPEYGKESGNLLR